MADLAKALEQSEAIPPIAESAKAMIGDASVPGAVEALDAVREAAVSAALSIKDAMKPKGTLVPPEIPADGSRDVGNDLHEWLNDQPDGSVIVFPELGQYWCENTVAPRDKVFTIEGNGSYLFAKTDGSGVVARADQAGHKLPRSRSHFLAEGGDVTVRNLGVQGANPEAGAGRGAYVSSLEGQHAFDSEGGRLVLIDCFAGGVYGDLLYFGMAGSGGRVFGGRYSRSGRQGLAITGHTDFLADGMYLGEIGRTVIDLEPARGLVDGVVIRNSEFGDCRHLWFNTGGQGDVQNVLVENNLIHGVGMSATAHPSKAKPDQRRGPHAFLNNRCDMVTGGPQPFFRFANTDGVKVIGNAGHHQERGVPGVRTEGCTAIEVHSNQLTGVTTEWEDIP